MDFYGYLQKYQVNYRVSRLSYTPWPGRNGNKLTRVCAHTEGVPNNIPGTADRDIFAWFNNQSNGVNAHGYITFSGVFIEYIGIENGSWSVGNPDDNVQAYSIEAQDNGRFNDPATYTAAQYDTWARVYCAVKDYSMEHYGTNLVFGHDNWGLIAHRDRIPTRACPGALDLGRIIREAKNVWESIHNPPLQRPKVDSLYLVKVDDNTIEQTEDRESAFDIWLQHGGEVSYNGADITGEFFDMGNKLQETIDLLEAEVARLEAEVEALEANKSNQKSLFITFLSWIKSKLR